MRGRERRLSELESRIPQVSVEQAYTLVREGAVLLDVREADEQAEGSPAGAIRLGRGYLELRVEELLPEYGRALLVLCSSGARSLFAAQSLLDLGYRDVRSVAGGFEAWKRAGLPHERSQVLAVAERRRYARQIMLPEVGEAGQEKLASARVLIVGAGGLGSPAAMYLAAAGVGTLGIVDDDAVELSNLHRQILHTHERVGIDKTESARRTLQALNPALQVELYKLRLSSANAERLVADYPIVIDGTDNFPARYLLNDVCVKLERPYVYASVYRFEGQVSVLWPAAAARERTPCYRCLYPVPPPAALAPSCTETGVLGVLPGVLGTLQAAEALKLILGAGEPLLGRLLSYDALAANFREFRTRANPDCAYCRRPGEFPGYVDYEAFCRAAG